MKYSSRRDGSSWLDAAIRWCMERGAAAARRFAGSVVSVRGWWRTAGVGAAIQRSGASVRSRPGYAVIAALVVAGVVAFANRGGPAASESAPRARPDEADPGPGAAAELGGTPAVDQRLAEIFGAEDDLVEPLQPEAADGDDADTADDPGADSPQGPSPWSAPDRAVVPPDARVPKPASVRGLYLNAWAAGSSRKLDRLIRIARETEINTFVIDVKEAGRISYPSRIALAREIGADARYIPDIEAVIQKLTAAGIYPIARIVVFKDPVLAGARPELAVRHRDGGDWRDTDGYAWVDSYNREVWDYNIEIAREAVELGFAEVQWDYVRFPDVPRSVMETAVWPAAEGRSKADGIREFLDYSRDRLADLDVPVTADVFGLTVSARGDMGIGQQWEKMLDVTDVLLPMIYPSHFARGSYGIPYPNSEPYRTVNTALEHARSRTDSIEGAAAIRPWLQDFTLGKPAYGAAHVRAQIVAAHDAGIDEWVLWNPGSNYTVEALADANGNAPALPIPDTAWPARKDSTANDTTAADTAAGDTAAVDTLVVDTLRVMQDTLRATRETLVADTLRVTRDTLRAPR